MFIYLAGTRRDGHGVARPGDVCKDAGRDHHPLAPLPRIPVGAPALPGVRVARSSLRPGAPVGAAPPDHRHGSNPRVRPPGRSPGPSPGPFRPGGPGYIPGYIPGHIPGCGPGDLVLKLLEPQREVLLHPRPGPGVGL
eukprot:1179588-Prorocentrum_minimum.AAC.2